MDGARTPVSSSLKSNRQKQSKSSKQSKATSKARNKLSAKTKRGSKHRRAQSGSDDELQTPRKKKIKAGDKRKESKKQEKVDEKKEAARQKKRESDRKGAASRSLEKSLQRYSRVLGHELLLVERELGTSEVLPLKHYLPPGATAGPTPLRDWAERKDVRKVLKTSLMASYHREFASSTAGCGFSLSR
jgi:hypothetical protein